jgi:predicted acetyltransferase
LRAARRSRAEEKLSIEIRPVPAADQRRWYDAINVAFAEDVPDGQWELEQKMFEPDRALGVYDGDRVVGGGSAFSFRMTVPGGRKADVAGVTMVGVMPTHRRQGALRALMARQLADIRDRGEPMAALWASEGSIYQRFGYGLAIVNGSFDLERDRAVFRNPVEPSGRVDLRDIESARTDLKKVYDAYQARTPGFYERDDDWWDAVLSDAEFRRHGMSKRHTAVLTQGDEPVGYALYRIKGDWLPTGHANTLFVSEIVALDASSLQELWRYLFGVDLMHNIRSRLGPIDHPLMLMLAEPRRMQLRASDGVWLRIVDVKKALEARSYAADDSLVLEVSDSFMPEVGGRWRLTASGGNGAAEPTSDTPDIQLDITDLGAVYMGGFRFASLARAARTVECTPGARARADAMFASTDAPWCPEVF